MKQADELLCNVYCYKDHQSILKIIRVLVADELLCSVHCHKGHQPF